MVALLSDRVALTVGLIERFAKVDDPYVAERVMAVAYGVAMRSDDAEVLAPLADVVYRLVFASGEPPVHILLRDYARGVIERALYLGADIAVDASLVEPPYRSTWPHIPPAEELEKFDPFKQGDPTLEPSDAERAQARISFSVMRWDFARYIIGTKLKLRITTSGWQSPTKSQSGNHQTSSPTRCESHSTPSCGRSSTICGLGPARCGARLAVAGSGVRTAAVRSRCLIDLVPRSRNPTSTCRSRNALSRYLSDDQRTAYEAAKATRGTTAPRLALDIIQRYVVWRVFDLGWTAERFGELDSLIDRSASYATDSRRSRKSERMGKKYQWIAYHEILAHISDRHQYRVPYDDGGPKSAYKGTWQLSIRDIDPSTTVRATPSDHRRSEDPVTWWRYHAPIASIEDVGHEQWLQSDHDIPDRAQQLCFVHPDDASTWIKLQGIDIWELPAEPTYGLDETSRREIWLEAFGYLISATHIDEFIAWSETVDFWNHWMPEPPRAGSLYFGELGWSSAFDALVGDLLESQHPTPAQGTPCPTPLQPAAFEYHTEGGGYDCSLSKGYALYRPNSRLVEALELRWTGQGADYEDPLGTLVAFDPSAQDTSSAALLVREESLARHLDETGSALVWAILGGKRAMDPADSVRAWSGSLQLTGAAVYRPEGPSGFLTTRLDIPDQDPLVPTYNARSST